MITGGAKRLGKAMALFLAKHGYDIVLHYNASKEAAHETKKEIESFSVNCYLCAFDLCLSQDYDSFFSALPDAFSPVSLLIHNASVFVDTDYQNLREDDFDRDFSVHVKAPLFISQAFSKQTESGQIIMMLDSRVSTERLDHFAYTLAKKSQLHLTKMLAKELAPKIRVNAICPGPILPPPGESEAYLDNVSKTTPLEKAGSCDKIVKAVDYLLEADFVTGECLYVDGGQHLV